MKFNKNKCSDFDTYYNDKKKENKKTEIICIKTDKMGPTGPTGPQFEYSGNIGDVLFIGEQGLTGTSNLNYLPTDFEGKGNLVIEGKLTVKGPIDPTWLELVE